jgi:hypothetical protein
MRCDYLEPPRLASRKRTCLLTVVSQQISPRSLPQLQLCDSCSTPFFPSLSVCSLFCLLLCTASFFLFALDFETLDLHLSSASTSSSSCVVLPPLFVSLHLLSLFSPSSLPLSSLSPPSLSLLLFSLFFPLSFPPFFPSLSLCLSLLDVGNGAQDKLTNRIVLEHTQRSVCTRAHQRLVVAG